MNMPPRPSHMYAQVNPDAARLNQPPGQDVNQRMMRGQQAMKSAEVLAESRSPQQIGGMVEDMRGDMMSQDSAALKADNMVQHVKAGVLEAMGLKGMPQEGMLGIRQMASTMYG